MAHAVVMQVNLVGDRVEGMKMLDEVVVPLAKAQPGFQQGTWMHTSDTKTGTGVIVFDTEEQRVRPWLRCSHLRADQP